MLLLFLLVPAVRSPLHFEDFADPISDAAAGAGEDEEAAVGAGVELDSDGDVDGVDRVYIQACEAHRP